MPFDVGFLVECHDKVQKLRTDLLFQPEEPDQSDPFAVQLFLAGIGALEQAQRFFMLAHLKDVKKGEEM